MFYKIVRTKKIRMILIITIIAIVITSYVLYRNYTQHKKYEEQAVIAENYLIEGDYIQAVEAYQKALSMKDSEQELLSIGLAEAYIGIHDYEKALEVLRLCYQKTFGVAIMEKIEAVSQGKTDYEYLNKISLADRYFSNLEYDKAIIEYEKAKSIKSKEVTPYGQIAEAYIAKGDYLAAREEVLKGLAVVQSEVLEEILSEVELGMLNLQYDEVIVEAEEFIYQENYDEAIKKYLLAIALKPNIDIAYIELADTYLLLEKYDYTIALLETAMKRINSSIVEELYEKAILLQKDKKERQRILLELYEAMRILNIDQIKEIMMLAFYKEKIASGAPIYYGELGEENFNSGNGMIIYDDTSVYFGNIKDRRKNGVGVYLVITSTDMDYYYYQGEWNNDIPSGVGKTEEETSQVNDAGEKHIRVVVTEGEFENGYENGAMKKYIYDDKTEKGNISYKAKLGEPMPLLDESGKQIWVIENKEYIVGWIYRKDELTDEYYSANSSVRWGFKPYLENK